MNRNAARKKLARLFDELAQEQVRLDNWPKAGVGHGPSTASLHEKLDAILRLLEQRNIMEDRPLNSAEACEVLGIALSTLRHWTSEGRIPYYKSGRANSYRRSELIEFRLRNRVRTREEHERDVRERQ